MSIFRFCREVIETGRRLLLTAVLSVIYTGTNLQVIVGILMAVLFMKLYSDFGPYIKDQDDLLQEIAQYQVSTLSKAMSHTLTLNLWDILSLILY